MQNNLEQDLKDPEKKDRWEVRGDISTWTDNILKAFIMDTSAAHL